MQNILVNKEKIEELLFKKKRSRDLKSLKA